MGGLGAGQQSQPTDADRQQTSGKKGGPPRWVHPTGQEQALKQPRDSGLAKPNRGAIRGAILKPRPEKKNGLHL